jgi:hypothetical protein
MVEEEETCAERSWNSVTAQNKVQSIWLYENAASVYKRLIIATNYPEQSGQIKVIRKKLWVFHSF